MSWNFALILFVLLVLTGIIWALDLAVLRRGRERRAQEAMAQYDAALIGDSQEAERLRREAGDKARHGKWGIGTVVSVKGSGEEVELKIAFPGEGVKGLMQKYAPIEKV